MAIDRTKKWRCTWQGENGWANMLEIIPAGDMLAGTDLTVTTFGRALFEMDFAEYGFEDLPFGMMKAPACSFSFDWRNLPSGLKELLATPEYEAYTGYYTTTLFVFYSDEGLGGGYVLQYIGAQANTLGNKFTLSGASTVFKVQIETLDLLKTIMDVSRPSLIFEAATSTGTVINSSYATTIMQGSSSLDFATDTPSPHGLSKYDIAPQSYHLLLYSIAKIRDTIASELAVKLAYWNRAGLFGYEATVAQTQYPNAAIALYKQSLNTNHAKSTALDETNTLVLGHVCELDSGTYFSRGGFFSNDAGKEGANEYDSFASFVTAFAENFLCKLKILPVTQVNGISGDTLLTYSMYWLKGWESTVSTITLTPKIIGNEYDITTAEKVFLIAEVETPNMKDKDVNLSRVAVTINDKADVWSVKAILHNSPTIADDEQNGGTFGIFTLNSSNSMGEAKLYPRKLYYTVSGANSLFKVHESVVITDGINTKTVDSPTALPTDWSLRNVQGWAITTQQTQGLQRAIAEYITENWSSRSQCLRDFTCKMVGGNSDGSIMPRHVGNRFTLPAISALGAGARSLLLTVKPDFDKGHITCKFLSIPD